MAAAAGQESSRLCSNDTGFYLYFGWILVVFLVCLLLDALEKRGSGFGVVAATCCGGDGQDHDQLGERRPIGHSTIQQ